METRRAAVESAGEACVVLLDSIAAVRATDAGAVLVTGSHGGLSTARYALSVPLAAVVFNDAGIGTDEAGIAGLALLDANPVPAVAVAHDSAPIGDAADTLESGVVSHANGPARQRGVAPGQSAAPCSFPASLPRRRGCSRGMTGRRQRCRRCSKR
jgi:hypothetical protein